MQHRDKRCGCRMDMEEQLIDVASVSHTDAQVLGADVIQISALASLPSGFPTDLVSCTLKTVVRRNYETGDGPSNDNEERIPDVHISPLMYEIMCAASAMTISQERLLPNNVSDLHWVPVSVSPLQSPSYSLRIGDLLEIGKRLHWTARRINIVKDLPPGSTINLSLLYIEPRFQQFCEETGNFQGTLQSTLAFFLGGRIIKAGTTTAFYTEEGLTIATVDQIEELTGAFNSANSHDVAYRLGLFVNYKLCLKQEYAAPNATQDALQIQDQGAGGVEWQSECPGYDSVAQSLVQLAGMKGAAAPSGILLTGSPQVGKTHLASSAAHHLNAASAVVHWVSAQDLLLQASWADESDLLAILRPPDQLSPDQVQVLILDDLHVFETEESSLGEDSIALNTDQEMLVVKNAVLQVIDEMASKRNENIKGYTVLGIAQSSSSLPSGFVKSGRLEKEVAMLPPTENQREMILRNLIPVVNAGPAGDDSLSQKWAEALTPVTVGCVAGDLRRILSHAWTRALARGEDDNLDIPQARLSWDDLQKAAQTYVPMQLETVDVCKPNYPLSSTSADEENIKPSGDTEGWAEVHKFSWESFGGYPLVKKRLLRTVVGPWKRFLKSLDHDSASPSSSSSLMGLSPPPGVLFHGESGTGKSLAAVCLASSLGLPMIKVKAADVMDKWLGGSEAIIRSLFARARSAAPCILLFDELDSIATNRASGDEGGAEVMARLLSTLLNEMDGISSDRRRQSVLVVACTNRLMDLDAALLRPGRLEEHIHLKHPDFSDIRDMFRVHLSRVPVSHEIDLEALARDLAEQHASGAEVEGLCHGACLCAAHRANASDVVLIPEDIESALVSSS